MKLQDMSKEEILESLDVLLECDAVDPERLPDPGGDRGG